MSPTYVSLPQGEPSPGLWSLILSSSAHHLPEAGDKNKIMPTKHACLQVGLILAQRPAPCRLHLSTYVSKQVQQALVFHSHLLSLAGPDRTRRGKKREVPVKAFDNQGTHAARVIRRVVHLPTWRCWLAIESVVNAYCDKVTSKAGFCRPGNRCRALYSRTKYN